MTEDQLDALDEERLRLMMLCVPPVAELEPAIDVLERLGLSALRPARAELAWQRARHGLQCARVMAVGAELDRARGRDLGRDAAVRAEYGRAVCHLLAWMLDRGQA